jgi:flavin-dependent dehydrogenase
MLTRDQSACDVAVLGGGPAGTMTARLLAQRGISVTVLEAGDYSHQTIGQTLSPALNSVLSTCGIDQPLDESVFSPCIGVDSVWGRKAVQRNDFFWTPYGQAWHIGRPSLDRELARAASEAGAQVLPRTRILSSSALRCRQWSLAVQAGNSRHTLRCRFLVDATGRSGNGTLVKSGRARVYDRLVGIGWIGKTQVEYPYTLIETVRDGWFYASPLPNSHFTIVLLTDSDIFRGNSTERTRFWRCQLRMAKHIRETFPESLGSYPQLVSSASTILRVPANGSNWLSVGDAAMSCDPVCGQGVYFALVSAAKAAAAIEEYFRTGSLPHSYDAWICDSFRRYRSIRQRYYSIETRWHGSLFWARHQAG